MQRLDMSAGRSRVSPPFPPLQRSCCAPPVEPAALLTHRVVETCVHEKVWATMVGRFGLCAFSSYCTASTAQLESPQVLWHSASCPLGAAEGVLVKLLDTLISAHHTPPPLPRKPCPFRPFGPRLALGGCIMYVWDRRLQLTYGDGDGGATLSMNTTQFIMGCPRPWREHWDSPAPPNAAVFWYGENFSEYAKRLACGRVSRWSASL